MGPEWADLVALPPRHRICSLASARCAISEVDRRATWACWRRYGRGRTASSRVQRRIADVRPLPTVLSSVALFVRARALVSLIAERLDRFPRGVTWGLIVRRVAARMLPEYPVRAHVDVWAWLTTRALRCDSRCTSRGRRNGRRTSGVRSSSLSGVSALRDVAHDLASLCTQGVA